LGAKDPEARGLRKVLVRLSGRQMRWKKEFTYNALLAFYPCKSYWKMIALIKLSPFSQMYLEKKDSYRYLCSQFAV
jgi:hypothetical protein